MSSKAVVLLSGGIDSSLCVLIAREWGRNVHTLAINYGQLHREELVAARRLSPILGAIDHKTLNIPTLRHITREEPYVPGRNSIFLAYALSYAETIGAGDIFLGINADDVYFPDCSPEFYHSANSLASVATRGRVWVNAPLLNLHKAQIIKKAAEMGVPLGETLSCYAGSKCGECLACVTRARGFAEAGINDPSL